MQNSIIFIAISSLMRYINQGASLGIRAQALGSGRKPWDQGASLGIRAQALRPYSDIY
jgi:hypothetical protein